MRVTVIAATAAVSLAAAAVPAQAQETISRCGYEFGK